MNHKLNKLQPYPFARLKKVMQNIKPNSNLRPIALDIGEPKHPSPAVVLDAIREHLDGLSSYPTTLGSVKLREAMSAWLLRRYGVNVDVEREILPVLGTREALFSFVQAVVDVTPEQSSGNSSVPPLIVSPNPFYQIYEGAALLSGAEVRFVACDAPRFAPNWADVPENDWPRVQVVFVCSPNNPTGHVMKTDDWRELFTLQDRYDFVIASDECYSEIYTDENHPPLGMLQVAQDLGHGFEKLIMFTSLSKRSNVPGLRSGFVAGDADILAKFLLYRTYHGSAMSNMVQAASIAAWSDETHVRENREQYRLKFAAVLPILRQCFEVQAPEASFYVWLKVPGGDDVAFAKMLWEKAAIKVLPGQFLSRETVNGRALLPGSAGKQAAGSPLKSGGKGYVRLALVAPLEECEEAARRIVRLFAC